MASGEDWLWRPVMEGLCKYESVIDGTLNIEDIATMNEMLDVRHENEMRVHEMSKG